MDTNIYSSSREVAMIKRDNNNFFNWFSNLQFTEHFYLHYYVLLTNAKLLEEKLLLFHVLLFNSKIDLIAFYLYSI